MKRAVMILFLLISVTLTADPVLAQYEETGAEMVLQEKAGDCGSAAWIFHINRKACKQGYEENCGVLNSNYAQIIDKCQRGPPENPRYFAAYVLGNAYQEGVVENSSIKETSIELFEAMGKYELENPFRRLAAVELYKITGEGKFLENTTVDRYSYSDLNCGWQLMADAELKKLGISTSIPDRACRYMRSSKFAEQRDWAALGYIELYEAGGENASKYLNLAQQILSGHESKHIWGISWDIYTLARYCSVTENTEYCKRALERAGATYCLETEWKSSLFKEKKVCSLEADLSEFNKFESQVDSSYKGRSKPWLSMAYLELGKVCGEIGCPKSVKNVKVGYPDKVRYKSRNIFTVFLLLVLALLTVIIFVVHRRYVERPNVSG